MTYKAWAEQNGWACIVHGNGQSEHWEKDGVKHWAPWMDETRCYICGEVGEVGPNKMCKPCENACPMCGNEVDEDTGVCCKCKEVVR